MPTRIWRNGGFGTDTVTDVVPLYAWINGNGNVSAFRATASAGYAITTGKTFYIVRTTVMMVTNAGASNMTYSFGYCDNDVGFDTTTARTNPVRFFGDSQSSSTNGQTGGLMINGIFSTPYDYHGLVYGVPAGKYIYCRQSGDSARTSSIQLFGYEV